MAQERECCARPATRRSLTACVRSKPSPGSLQHARAAAMAGFAIGLTALILFLRYAATGDQEFPVAYRLALFLGIVQVGEAVDALATLSIAPGWRSNIAVQAIGGVLTGVGMARWRRCRGRGIKRLPRAGGGRARPVGG